MRDQGHTSRLRQVAHVRPNDGEVGVAGRECLGGIKDVAGFLNLEPD
jgi:hypothetical protein